MSDPAPMSTVRPWAIRGGKAPVVIGDEGYERDRLPEDAVPLGGPHYRDSEGGIWTVIPEREGRWAQRGGQYRRRLRRLDERARHGS